MGSVQWGLREGPPGLAPPVFWRLGRQEAEGAGDEGAGRCGSFLSHLSPSHTCDKEGGGSLHCPEVLQWHGAGGMGWRAVMLTWPSVHPECGGGQGLPSHWGHRLKPGRAGC